MDSQEFDQDLVKIYKECWQPLLRHFRKKGLQEEEIKDLFHEALYALQVNIRKGLFDPQKGNPRQYLFGIAEKLRLKMYRQSERNPSANLFELINRYTIDPEKNTDLAEVIRVTMACMKKLTPKDRQILELFYLKEYAYESIVESLNFSNVEAAKMAKSRALEKLRGLVLNFIPK